MKQWLNSSLNNLATKQNSVENAKQRANNNSSIVTSLPLFYQKLLVLLFLFEW